MWGVPTAAMQCEWLGERVATVDVARAVAGVVTGREDAGWGPNAVFRFPLAGGTGAIWRGVSALLPRRKQARPRPHRLASITPMDSHGKEEGTINDQW